MQQTNVFVVLPGENILENGVNVEGHKAVNGSALQGTERAEADYATDQNRTEFAAWLGPEKRGNLTASCPAAGTGRRR